MEGSQGGAVSSRTTSSLPALYDAHYTKMVKLASMYLDQRECAEEVVQDAFVKLLNGNYSIQPGNEAAYLRRMVLNGAHSTLRKRRVRRRHVPDEPGVVAAAEEGGVTSTERDRILNAIRKLPKKQASVIILRYYLDLSEAEIAESLGMARGSVKSHAHRGLAKLQRMLGDDTLSDGSSEPSPMVTEPAANRTAGGQR